MGYVMATGKSVARASKNKERGKHPKVLMKTLHMKKEGCFSRAITATMDKIKEAVNCKIGR